MRSFGTDTIIDPFDTFAAHLVMALHFPYLHLLADRLTGSMGEHRGSHREPPRGAWVLCGYGRFGKAVHKRLQYEGIPATIVEPHPEAMGYETHYVVGRGTEATTLRAAHKNETTPQQAAGYLVASSE
jgi:hypothetical protein